MAVQTQTKIPVVDFSDENLKPGTASWLKVRNDVCRALEEYGCFAAELGNKFPLELHEAIFGAAQELFDFPTETKEKVTSEKLFHGYVASPLRERMMIDNATSPEVIRKLTNIFWPNGNDHVRESADAYVKKMTELDEMVTRMVFENYGAEKYYDSHLELTSRTLSLLRYKKHQKDGNNEGIKTHTDKHFTTILHQNRVRGLEVKTKDGEWIGFDPSPSSFLFLAGDALQVWSNDRIQASLHRVMLVENEERYSLGTFAFHEGTIHVPEELIDEKHPLQYNPFNNNEYAKAQVALIQKEISLKSFCGVNC
ncbi:hypothetical protein I3843_02G084700 [Carya illinoinensis]|uniref:Fe2OG dioxygenase domain-containing protein n=1 Tax=Carya illinoinensis TaxID=32201 RepID=A0A922FU44_CARIL|nr:hypothetical protein I3842_02G098100 [Carya illinoinensis]KAG7991607.1 hypothetical protein I3843_02G084700 [Carya illinoinensis]